MDIYSFLNSPDVAAHCKKIGHKFNPLEMAVIIAMSKKTVREKHTAWQDIIDNYPDMPVHKRNCFNAQESLHDFLKELIKLEEKWLKDFYTAGNGAVYRPDIVRWHYDHSDHRGCYSTFEKSMEEIAESLEYWKEDEITYVIINKDYIDGNYGRDSVWLNFDKEVFYFTSSVKNCSDNLNYIFIHIPLPFEKGDLLESDGNVCVLISLPHWSKRYAEMCRGEANDSSDMFAYTYDMCDDGVLNFNDEPMQQFTYDLTYFKGELTGHDHFLGLLSDFIKNGNEPLWSLLYSHEKIRALTFASDKNTLHDSEFRYWLKTVEESRNRENASDSNL